MNLTRLLHILRLKRRPDLPPRLILENARRDRSMLAPRYWQTDNFRTYQARELIADRALTTIRNSQS